jgi:hypothetical protein
MLILPTPSSEQAAAIAASLARFMRATAPSAPPAREPDAWQRTAILEGVAREPEPRPGDPWINT